MSSSPTEHSQSGARTHHEACLDVLYGVQFNDFNERFYRRLDGIFSLVTLFSGSAVFASFLAHASALSGILGILIAFVAYVDRVIRPAHKAVQCQLHREKFGALSARMATLPLEQLDAELRLLQASNPPTIDLLELPAYWSNLRSNGYNVQVPRFGFWTRLAMLLA